MKTFKKADTFGEEGEWQVDEKDREVVRNAFQIYSDETLYEELLDDMIVVLAKLGYVKIENKQDELMKKQK